MLYVNLRKKNFPGGGVWAQTPLAPVDTRMCLYSYLVLGIVSIFRVNIRSTEDGGID